MTFRLSCYDYGSDGARFHREIAGNGNRTRIPVPGIKLSSAQRRKVARKGWLFHAQDEPSTVSPKKLL